MKHPGNIVMRQTEARPLRRYEIIALALISISFVLPVRAEDTQEQLLNRGEYREALAKGEELLKTAADSAVAERTAEAAFRLGEYDRAAALIEKISTPRAEWMRASLATRKGDQQAARASLERIANLQNQRQKLKSTDLAVVAAALAELGKFKEANQVYQEAVKSDASNAYLKAQWGKLMARKHNPGDAEALFGEALQANLKETDALLGMAQLDAERWNPRAEEWLKKTFEINPNLAEAHLLRARMSLEKDDYKAASEALDQIAKINPRLLEAWSLYAVLEYLQDKKSASDEWLARIQKENPRYGEVFADLGEFSGEKRQVPEAVEFYRRAVNTDPDLDDARADLGINLFRLGKEEEARKVLEEAYGRDPYNASTVNTLRLMDSFVHFDSFETPHFAVKLQKKESEVLRPYVEELLEKTIQDLAKRYNYMPKEKVVFEMYPDHEDFAVRTVGLPGLGALGATFGNVVAMDSPSGRPLGAFHWGSTLWHEVTHVISLGITSGRVPRWFTEGLSVYEETQSHRGWGDPMELETVKNLKEHKLLPLQDLNGAFVHPTFPGQVPFAYFQGGLACQYIVDKFGFPKILAMLHAYAQGRNDTDAIREALGISTAEFDDGFMKYAKEKTYGFAENVDLQWANPGKKPEELREEIQKHPRNYFAHLRLAADLVKDSKPDEAAAEAQAAKEIFPLYVSSGNPYTLLASIYETKGENEKAVAELQSWKDRMGRDPETFKKLARLQADLGKTQDAVQTLEAALQVSMFDVEIHNLLGEWSMKNANPRVAVREYKVLLALGPADKAGAHYHLASAYQALSDGDNAKLEVLAALEIAPSYRPAQKLLLELNGK